MQEHTISDLMKTAPDFLLRMSRTRFNYWAEFGLDIPLGILLILASLRRPDLHFFTSFSVALLGLLIFSYLEYTIHRWLFHGSIPVFVQGHLAHHKNPQGYDALPFFLPALVVLGLASLFALLMPASYAYLQAGIMAFGYATYGLSHFSIHHVHFHQPLARRWAAAHLIHHYHPESNFGVTTPLWDILLGTRYIIPHHQGN
jgi:sterol desaturase/sphingolipid hydroxylase (fatty acid hydroxylase superfamily)